MRALCAHLASLPLLAAGLLAWWGGPDLILWGVAATVLAYGAGVGWAVMSPARGPADRLAGTRLVRK